MMSCWKIQRHMTAQAEAQERWDLAYQSLVKWSSEQAKMMKKESDEHEGRPLCAGINPKTTAESKH